ncbi:UNVERIFIED_CONTAM: putative chloride channel-like protein CLC-g, partial [Sesamum indicum]
MMNNNLETKDGSSASTTSGENEEDGTFVVSPEAAGSGIPEVKAYLNGVDAFAIFSFRTLVVK